MWGVARELLLMRCSVVFIQKLAVSSNSIDGTVTPLASDAAKRGSEVWPTEYRRPKPVQQDGIPIPDEAQRAKKKSSKAKGIKAPCCYALQFFLRPAGWRIVRGYVHAERF